MSELARGLHETLITEALEARIDRLDTSLHADAQPLRREDAGD